MVTLWDSRGAGQIAGPNASPRSSPPNPLREIGQAAGVVRPPTFTSVWSVAFHLDGRTVASATDSGVVDLWDWRSDRHRFLLSQPTRPLWSFVVMGACATVTAGGVVMLAASLKRRGGGVGTAEIPKIHDTQA